MDYIKDILNRLIDMYERRELSLIHICMKEEKALKRSLLLCV